jgi:hypothetical protein
MYGCGGPHSRGIPCEPQVHVHHCPRPPHGISADWDDWAPLQGAYTNPWWQLYQDPAHHLVHALPTSQVLFRFLLIYAPTLIHKYLFCDLIYCVPIEPCIYPCETLLCVHRPSIDWHLVGLKAAEIIRDLITQTPEFNDFLTLPSLASDLHDVINVFPHGFG